MIAGETDAEKEGGDRGGRVDLDHGSEYFARRNPAKTAAWLANRIRNLGYQVEIRAAA